MTKTALEVIVERNTKDLNDITSNMQRMVEGIEGLRDDMAERSERYIKLQTDHALEDSNRFGRLETKLALYVGMGMVFAAFAKDIITGIVAVGN